MDFLPLRGWGTPPQFKSTTVDPAVHIIGLCCGCILFFCQLVWCNSPQGPGYCSPQAPKIAPLPEATPQEWAVYHTRVGAFVFPLSSMVGGLLVVFGKGYLDSKLYQDLLALDIAYLVLFNVSLGLLCWYGLKAQTFNKRITTSCLTGILIIWIFRLAYMSYCLQVFLSQEHLTNAGSGVLLFSFGLFCECSGALFFICYSVNYWYYLYTRPDAKKALPKPGPAIEHVKPFLRTEERRVGKTCCGEESL